MFGVQVGAGLPQFGKEFLVKCRAQVADTFRAACAAFRSHHPLDHLDVMETPERKVLVMFKQRFGELKLFVPLFEVSENLQHRLSSEAVEFFLFGLRQRFISGGGIETATS